MESRVANVLRERAREQLCDINELAKKEYSCIYQTADERKWRTDTGLNREGHINPLLERENE